MATELPSDPFELRHAATDRATFVTVPERRMFAIDGLGDPRLAAFVLASDSLRAVEERVRGRVQRTTGRKISPAVLECAWWTHPEPPSQDLAASFADRSTWHWQQMIEIPPEASDEDAQASIGETRAEFDRPVRLVRGSSSPRAARRRSCTSAVCRPSTAPSWPSRRGRAGGPASARASPRDPAGRLRTRARQPRAAILRPRSSADG